MLVAAACVVLHLRSSLTPSIGLTRDGGASSLIRAIQLGEARATDLKFRFRGPRTPHPDVVVVAVDEKSAQRFGLFPWPRERIAAALQQLATQKVKAVGLDITFTDEVDNDAKTFRDLLARLKPGEAPELRAELERRATASDDQRLQEAFDALGPRAVQGVFTFSQTELHDFSAAKLAEYERLLEPHVIRSVPGPGGSTIELPIDRIGAYPEYLAQAPLQRFTTGGSALGHVNFVPDVDGTVRRTPALIKLRKLNAFLPSMALRTAATALNATIVPKWDGDDFHLTGVELRGADGAAIVTLPYESSESFALIDHVGPGSSFPTISIADVIDGTLPPGTLAGKVVLIGITLTGSSGDQRVTPFRELEPGVYTHASIVSNLLQGRFLVRPDAAVVVESLAMLAVALLLAFAVPRLTSFVLKAVLMIALVGAWGVISQLAFDAGTQVAMVLPQISFVIESFILIFLGYLSVDREKLKLRTTFTRYLGEDVMEEALQHPDKLNRGEKREMTVLFSDIRGFTTLSERMLPEKLAAFINEYLSPMTRIVFDEKGTLDKYIGDAIMAFWNAPLDQPDHALRACRASLAMLARLDELKAKCRAENFPEFDIGVGINTGTMIVGNMGSDVRVDYTVMGDAVNLASRLEGTNKEYETRVILGEGTWPHIKRPHGVSSTRRGAGEGQTQAGAHLRAARDGHRKPRRGRRHRCLRESARCLHHATVGRGAGGFRGGARGVAQRCAEPALPRRAGRPAQETRPAPRGTAFTPPPPSKPCLPRRAATGFDGFFDRFRNSLALLRHSPCQQKKPSFKSSAKSCPRLRALSRG